MGVWSQAGECTYSIVQGITDRARRRVPSLLLQRNGLVSLTKNGIIISYAYTQWLLLKNTALMKLPMIPFIDYTIMGVVKTVGVVKCPDIHFKKNLATMGM